MSLLKIKNLSKIYKVKGLENFKALDNINLSFKKGELISIIGESGSGKSTLMNLIGGLDGDYEGEISFCGKNLKSFKEKELDAYRERHIGFVFQSFNLIPHLSVLDNVAVALSVSNVSKVERIKRASDILIKLGLEKHLKKKPSQLSGGQKQRVAIARALINDPDIILADEPTGSLDSQTTLQILDIMKEIAQEGKLVIMVTHSESVASISSRIIEITDGKIIKNESKSIFNKKFKNKIEQNKYRQNFTFRSAIKLSVHNMLASKTKNILMSIGVAIGIASLILMLAFGNGIRGFVNSMRNEYINPLVVEVTMPKQEGNFFGSPSFEDEDIQILSEIKNVVAVDKGMNIYSFGNDIQVSYNDESISIFYLSTISAEVSISEDNLIEGRLPESGEIVVCANTESKLGGNLLNSTVTLTVVYNNKTLSRDVVISGIKKDSGMSGGQQSFMVNSLYVRYDDFEEMAADESVVLKPNVIYLITDDSQNTKQIKNDVKILGYSGAFEERMFEMFDRMLLVLSVALLIIAGISLVVSAIMILVVLYISVSQRTSEIGVLKAIGFRRKDVKRIFVSESFLIGFLSGISGIILSAVLGGVINLITISMFNVSVVIFSFWYFLSALILSILISVLSGLYPSAKASKLDPVEALRRE